MAAQQAALQRSVFSVEPASSSLRYAGIHNAGSGRASQEKQSRTLPSRRQLERLPLQPAVSPTADPAGPDQADGNYISQPGRLSR